MKRGRKFIMNTALLTAVTLGMRGIGLVFQVYMSRKIGAEGMGLYYLVMSVNVFAATFAISGSRFATTRLVSEKIGVGDTDGAEKTVKAALIYALIFGVVSMVLLFFGAGFIGNRLIGDGRSVFSLKLLGFGMPFLSMGAVLGGYYTALCKVSRAAACGAAEELVKIAAIILIFEVWGTGSIEENCAAIIFSGVLGELLSFLMIWLQYRSENKRKVKPDDKKLVKRLVSVAMPLAVTAYVRTGLSAVQNMLVPSGLRKSGATSERALADYGTIQGMVFPVITFPAALFTSIADLIVPELTDAQVQNDHGFISRTVSGILKAAFTVAVFIMAVLIAFAENFGLALYGNSDVGDYILRLSVLMPFMFLDTVTDGMLRGLNQHMYSMKYNVIDSCISTVIIYLLIPFAAVKGYIFVLYFSELMNFGLSIMRLSKVTQIRISVFELAKTLIAAVGAVSFTELMMNLAGVGQSYTVINLGICTVISTVIYVLLLKLMGCITKETVLKVKKAYFC